jgi:hypothetical protein
MTVGARAKGHGLYTTAPAARLVFVHDRRLRVPGRSTCDACKLWQADAPTHFAASMLRHLEVGREHSNEC